jgi:hypothetical protein
MASKRRNQKSVLNEIDNTFDRIDTIRIDGLKRSQRLLTVKSKSFEREKERLTKKLGKDHPRVKKLSIKLQYYQKRYKVFNDEINKLNINVPKIDSTTYMVHGRVLDQNRNPLFKLTACLCNEKGEWIKELGYCCTDKRGYFSIRNQVSQKDKEQFKAVRLNRMQQVESKWEAQFIGTPLFIMISDENKKIVYKDSRPLFIRPATIDYREIVLKDISVCTPPPEKGEKPPGKTDIFGIKGIILDEQGKPVKGARVYFEDKAQEFSKKLGYAVTDDEGKFAKEYKKSDFPDLSEKKPDIFLKVTDKKGKELYSRSQAIHIASGKIESVNITLKASPESAEKPPAKSATKPKDKETGKTIITETKKTPKTSAAKPRKTREPKTEKKDASKTMFRDKEEDSSKTLFDDTDKDR